MNIEQTQSFNFNPQKRIKADSRARTDQDFLQAAELRGMEEPSRHEERAMPINELGSDLLAHDQAEEWGLDKDDDPDGIILKDIDGNQRVIMTDNYNDLGELRDDDGLSLEDTLVDAIDEVSADNEPIILKRASTDYKNTVKENKVKSRNDVRNNSRLVWPKKD